MCTPTHTHTYHTSRFYLFFPWKILQEQEIKTVLYICNNIFILLPVLTRVRNLFLLLVLTFYYCTPSVVKLFNKLSRYVVTLPLQKCQVRKCQLNPFLFFQTPRSHVTTSTSPVELYCTSIILFTTCFPAADCGFFYALTLYFRLDMSTLTYLHLCREIMDIHIPYFSFLIFQATRSKPQYPPLKFVVRYVHIFHLHHPDDCMSLTTGNMSCTLLQFNTEP